MSDDVDIIDVTHASRKPPVNCAARMDVSFFTSYYSHMFFANRELAQRIENAEAALGAGCVTVTADRSPDIEATTLLVGGGIACFAGRDSHLTQTIGLGMGTPVDAAELDRLESFYRERDTPVVIELCPLVDPALTTVLADRGYRLVEHSNALVRKIEADESFKSTPGITIQSVRPGEINQWAELVARGFMDGQDVTADFVDIVATGAQLPEARCCLALIDGQPAGGAAVTLRDGIAASYGHSTLPAYRGRGIQSAMIRWTLTTAAANRCSWAYMFTQPASASQRNAERNGFRVAYTRSKLVRDFR